MKPEEKKSDDAKKIIPLHSDVFLQDIITKYPHAIQSHDAFIIDEKFVLKFPQRRLRIDIDNVIFDGDGYELLSDTEIDLSLAAVIKEACLLTLGRYFLDDLFPEPALEKINGKIFLKTKFIAGKPLGSDYFDINPKRFIADLAKLTAIMVLFKNLDRYADNLIATPNGIFAIDLVECGADIELKNFDCTSLWWSRKFNPGATAQFHKIPLPPLLLTKLKQYEELYFEQIKIAIALIREKIKNSGDKACISAFLDEVYAHIVTLNHEKQLQFLDMGWYDKSRQEFLALTEKFSSVDKYQLLYPELQNFLRFLLDLSALGATLYANEEYDISIRSKPTWVFDIANFNSFGVTLIKLKGKFVDEQFCQAECIILF